MEAFEHTQGIVATFNRRTGRSDKAFPTCPNHFHRCAVHGGLLLSFQLFEKRQRFENWFPSLITGKFDGAQESREKATHCRIACHNFLVVVVISWTCQLIDGCDCLSDPGLFFGEKGSYLFISP